MTGNRGPEAVFRLGPRVYIERAAVDRTGLTGFGSRARRKILFATDVDKMDPLIKGLKAEFKSAFVNVRSYKDSQENLSERLSRAEKLFVANRSRHSGVGRHRHIQRDSSIR